jgi:hypothetical protein
MAGNDAADRNVPTDPWAALRADLRRVVVEAGLGRHEEALLGAARPALRLVAEDVSKRAPVVPAAPGSDDARRARREPPEARIDGSAPAFGRTRLGGVPDVPEGFRWPTRRRTRVRYGDRIEAGAPLSFVAQINLAELPPVDGAETQLPTRGMLWFFYDARFLTYDAEDADGFGVVYSEAGPTISGGPRFRRDGARLETRTLSSRSTPWFLRSARNSRCPARTPTPSAAFPWRTSPSWRRTTRWSSVGIS